MKLNINKTASLKTEVELHPHQQRVMNKDGDSVIVAHGVGSGKTLSGIARFEKLKENEKAHKALVVVPAGLRENFGKDGVEKFTNSTYNIVGNKQEVNQNKGYKNIDPNSDYNIISYEMFRKNPEGYLQSSGADTLILDEFHRGKNEGTATTEALKQLKGKYNNFIGLTGSLVSNSVSDVQPLVDIASKGNHQLGETKKEFEQKFIKRDQSREYKKYSEKRKPMIGFKNSYALEDEIKKYVDYMDYEDVKYLANMPSKNIKVERIPINSEQLKIYKGLLNENPQIKKMVLNKRLETMRDEDAAKAFTALVESRKLMNSIGSVKPGIDLSESAKITPKTKKLLDDLEEHLKSTPDGQAILFSHLINGGHDVLEKGLSDRGIEYGKFLGKGNKDITEESRQQDIRDFNDRKKRVMLISSAGGEGVSLNDTTWEGVLDPHYNPERMNQMEARGVRSNGLSHRSEDEREVEIRRYLATMPKTFGLFPSRYKTPDELIFEIAQNKEKQNQYLFDLLKEHKEKKK